MSILEIILILVVIIISVLYMLQGDELYKTKEDIKDMKEEKEIKDAQERRINRRDEQLYKLPENHKIIYSGLLKDYRLFLYNKGISESPIYRCKTEEEMEGFIKGYIGGIPPAI